MNLGEDLKAYLDGETAPDRTAEIEAAMGANAQLRHEAEELREIAQTLRLRIRQPEPVGLEGALRALSAKRKPIYLRPAFAWAACFALALVVGGALVSPKLGKTGDQAENAVETPAAQVGGGGPSPDAEDNRRRVQGLNGADQVPSAASPAEPMKAKEESKGVKTPRLATQLIRKAALTLSTPKLEVAQKQATDVARSLAGFVEAMRASAESDSARVELSLRVPEARFDIALNRLRALGKIESESASGEDVTAQVADAAARVRVMKAEEESYLGMLRNARKVGDLLEIRDRLSEVRQEIESLAAQEKALRHDAKFSTIALTLVESAPSPRPQARWQDQAWSGAVGRGAAVGRGLAKVGMNLFVLAPYWLPILACGWWFARRRA